MLETVRFKVSGEQQISRGFAALDVDTSDMSEPLGQMADVILNSIREQFATQGAAGLGHPWTPLSPDYAAWKLKKYGPKPILVRTGGMKGALLNRQTAVRVGPKQLVYEPRNSYAAYHQDGTTRMPQRKIVALTTAQKREAVDRVFSQWLHEQRVKAMGK